MSFGVVLPLFRVAFTVMVLQFVELMWTHPAKLGWGRVSVLLRRYSIRGLMLWWAPTRIG